MESYTSFAMVYDEFMIRHHMMPGIRIFWIFLRSMMCLLRKDSGAWMRNRENDPQACVQRI